MTTKKYYIEKEVCTLWLDACRDKRKINAPLSPQWTIYLQPSLFVNNEVGIIFDSEESQWIIRATAEAANKIETALKSERVEEILSSIN